jgi:single-stranded DNA-binding protein
MSRLNAVFTGNVVAEPIKKEVNGTTLMEFPVYINHTKKDKDSGEYVKTGDTTKIRVTLWRDLADSDIEYGDLVEVHCSLVEKEFDKKDGTPGRSIQSDWVESIVVKYRSNGNKGGTEEDTEDAPF